MVSTPEDTVTLVAVQIQLSEIKGILSTVVGEHSRRISDTESVGRQLRIDLTAVKDKADQRITETATVGTQNSSAIVDIRGDIDQIRSKQDATFGKAMLIVSPCLAGLALIWNMVKGVI